jgi:hypothetical protein
MMASHDEKKLAETVQRYGWRLIQDDSGHWYMIPSNCESNFLDWVEWTEECVMEGDPSEWDYDGMRIDGPHSIVIHEWS